MFEIIVTVVRPATEDEPAGTEIYRGEFDESMFDKDDMMSKLALDTSCVHWSKLKDA